MPKFIENYFTHNFMGAESNTSYIAGMNFTNLLIAVPLLTTFILLVINFIRSPHKPKILNTKFQIITLISYAIIIAVAVYYKNLLSTISYVYNVLNVLLTNHSIIIVFAYIPFMFLVWCIYNDNEQNSKENSNQHKNIELQIKNKIKQLQDENKFKNILINGHWGSGKSYFAKNTLSKSINSSIYISCTDYPDMFELVNALIYKSNNFIVRQLIRFSLSKLLSIISKTELRQYIGNNKIIILDEFERLVDYNKIDYMHIVSLIQYLNDEKNCICILIANEDHLTDVNQFNNVREKLISQIYHYKLEFEEVIDIIQTEYLKSAVSNLKTPKVTDKDKITINEAQELNNKIENHKKENISGIIDLNNSNFEGLKQHFQKWYQIDNNIRMIEHLYIKINQLYQATLQMIDEDAFYKEHYSSDNDKKNELFTGLFTYIDTVIIQLYYLYLKNPYNLVAIETLSIISYNATPSSEDSEEDKIKNQSNLTYYVNTDSIQNLALDHIKQYIITHENKETKIHDKSYDLNYITTNQIFNDINQYLVTKYLNRHEFIIRFLDENEYKGTYPKNIKAFMSKFKVLICESENASLIIKYFKQINIFEDSFVDSAKTESHKSLKTSTIKDYITFIENHKTNEYNKEAYINALIIDYLSGNSATLDIIKKQIINYYSTTEKHKLISIIYEITAQYASEDTKAKNFIEMISEIISNILEKYSNYKDSLIVLDFMYHSYDEFKTSLLKNNIYDII